MQNGNYSEIEAIEYGMERTGRLKRQREAYEKAEREEENEQYTI